ncbi:MAG: hypothetical protein WBL41_15830, partial [Terracidiphilus sp.]
IQSLPIPAQARNPPKVQLNGVSRKLEVRGKRPILKNIRADARSGPIRAECAPIHPEMQPYSLDGEAPFSASFLPAPNKIDVLN